MCAADSSLRLRNDGRGHPCPFPRMSYFLLILSGVIIGLIVAVPIGPVNLICIRRTLAFGPLNGFMSGLGASVGDTVFAIVTGFSLTVIAQLIRGFSSWIE